MEVLIQNNADAGCVLGARIIARLVREKPNAVLGLATGRTPLQLYQELIRLQFDGDRVVHEERLLGELKARIRDVRQGPDGFLYVLTDEEDGVLYRVGLNQD